MSTPIQISILDLANGIVIEENGYFFDQKDVLTLGYWAWEKMADFLPYDYYPNRNSMEEMRARMEELRAKMNSAPDSTNEIPEPVEATVPEESSEQ